MCLARWNRSEEKGRDDPIHGIRSLTWIVNQEHEKVNKFQIPFTCPKSRKSEKWEFSGKREAGTRAFGHSPNPKYFDELSSWKLIERTWCERELQTMGAILWPTSLPIGSSKSLMSSMLNLTGEGSDDIPEVKRNSSRTQFLKSSGRYPLPLLLKVAK